MCILITPSLYLGLLYLLTATAAVLESEDVAATDWVVPALPSSATVPPLTTAQRGALFTSVGVLQVGERWLYVLHI